MIATKYSKITLNKKKELQESLLDYIENNDQYDVNYKDLIRIIKDQRILKNCNELEHFLCLLIHISNNHHRNFSFFEKIERIIKQLSKKIKQMLSNQKIFHIFKNNKIILLFVINEKLIKLDDIIIKEIINYEKFKTPRYCHFFIPEIEEKLNDKTNKEIEEIKKHVKYDANYYCQKRLEGENDNYICTLIRNDSIIEFIKYINKNNISPTSKIPSSIYETNDFLIGKNPTLLEYATFFGSIQIVHYLLLSNAELSENLWEFAVHSNNAEIIHLLEMNEINPSDGIYEISLEESIKCHHNSISNYIKDNLLNGVKYQSNSLKKEDELEQQNEQRKRINLYGIKYENYFYFPEELKQNYLFYYISKYEYSKLVKTFINYKKKKENKITNNISIVFKEAVRNNILYIIYDLFSNLNCIYEKCFYCSEHLREMTIPNSINSIDKCSFYECKSLTRISIPSSVEIIGPYAFFGCLSLNEITISSSIKSIGKSAFSECHSLTEIIISPRMSTIEESCFQGCKSLSFVSLPSSIKKNR